MKQKITIFLAVVLPLSIVLLPTMVFGQSNPTEQGLSGIRSVFGISRFSTVRDASDLVEEVVRILLFFAGLIAVLFIILGGYRYMTAQGNDEQAEQGRKTLTNAIIGLVIIGLAWVIVNVVVSVIQRGR